MCFYVGEYLFCCFFSSVEVNGVALWPFEGGVVRTATQNSTTYIVWTYGMG